MPGGDRTGPEGKGARTGRGLGLDVVVVAVAAEPEAVAEEIDNKVGVFIKEETNHASRR